MIAVVRYSEIALKGRNRVAFERRLVANLKDALAETGASVHRRFGRIIVKLDAAERDAVAEALTRTFGIENFSFGREVAADIEAIAPAVRQLAREAEGWKTFRVSAKRQNKETFPMSSQDANRRLGAAVLGEFPDARVQLKGADLDIRVEIAAKEAYVTSEHREGPGGLPVGVSGRVVVLLSGGIDSPVAAWQMMKRGCEIAFIHFHSIPYTDRASVRKVEELAQLLAPWGADPRVNAVSFIDVQKDIVTNTKGEYRVILYRRAMMRIAEAYARSIGAKALVTGDALGQVASQTIENMAAIEAAVGLPILRPLIGFDKQDIMDRAERIGTYETSILPHGDCCSLFTPRHPATRSSAKEAARQEEALDPEILARAIEAAASRA